jgi:GT2 family glycosyltransferase
MTEHVRGIDPGALVTYVNFPTTEYLELPFVDFLAFNVYLEDPKTLTRYLARLQNMAGERPLLMAEIGLDSRRNGDAAQASVLKWQIETSFAMGCAGVFLFAWTDEWHRGGHEIEDWDFGLTRRDRQPKPALAVVSEAFKQTPFPKDRVWPRISVVVCSYNGSATIGETLQHLEKVDYPNYEVIVINDGSTDETPQIAARYNVKLTSTENRGLSAARNLGAELATGEIVAYTDDDAYPDPDWLTFLAAAFERTDHAAMGGPNIAPYGDNDIAECVANAPGGPLHVLIGDELAEHIPGCNMAYRRDKLLAVGGFDPQFRVAGDDVDVCWKIQERGWTLGFCSAAMVWHHRRPSVSRYLKQQRGYAKAEALLAAKWPEKYNNLGQMNWHGRIYGRGLIQTLLSTQRIYHGPSGSALFQSIYEPAPGLIGSLPLMPEWYALVGGITLLALLGLSWSPLLVLAPVALAAISATLWQAAKGALKASYHGRELTPARLLKLRARTTWLHLLQPWARLRGRIEHGIGPWRKAGAIRFGSALPKTRSFWSEAWAAPEDRLSEIASGMSLGSHVIQGGDFDTFDITVVGNVYGSVRVRAMCEEHGAGKQIIRFRTWPRSAAPALGVALVLAALATGAGLDRAWLASLVLGGGALALAYLVASGCSAAAARWSLAVESYATEAKLVPTP